MTQSSDSQNSGSQHRATEGSPPADWSVIPFDVSCASCGAALNGVSDALCPACGLSIDWSMVLPVDRMRCEGCHYLLLGQSRNRCPECGLEFEWEAVLESARTRGQRLFEFLWFDRPLPGLWRTVSLAVLRPKRLWSMYYRQTKPNVAALLVFLAFQVAIFARGWHIVAWFADPMMNRISSWLGANIRFFYIFRPGDRFAVFSVVAAAATFATLLLMFQSRRRLGIDAARLFRVFVHATPFAALSTTLWCVAEVGIDSTYFFSRFLNRLPISPYLALQYFVFIAACVVTWRNLAAGLSIHTLMPHARGVAMAAMLVGLVAGYIAWSW